MSSFHSAFTTSHSAPERDGAEVISFSKLLYTAVPSHQGDRPAHFHELQIKIRNLWDEEFTQRSGVVEGVYLYEIEATRHTHDHPDDTVDGCTACHLRERDRDGKPPITRVRVQVLRDAEPVELVESAMPARVHTKQKGSAYHRRIQKKWNKQVLGLTVKAPRREQVTFSMTAFAWGATAYSTSQTALKRSLDPAFLVNQRQR
jgi:hypothetical protein